MLIAAKDPSGNMTNDMPEKFCGLIGSTISDIKSFWSRELSADNIITKHPVGMNRVAVPS